MAVVLIAEDDVDVRFVLKRLFTRAGMAVLTAADGVSALQVAVERHPDVVVTDLDMPGMTGLQLCAAIRADRMVGDVPVAILSGSLRPGDSRAVDVRACGTWMKPFASVELIGAVKRLLAAGHHDHQGDPSPCPLIAIPA